MTYILKLFIVFVIYEKIKVAHFYKIKIVYSYETDIWKWYSCYGIHLRGLYPLSYFLISPFYNIYWYMTLDGTIYSLKN